MFRWKPIENTEGRRKFEIKLIINEQVTLKNNETRRHKPFSVDRRDFLRILEMQTGSTKHQMVIFNF
jgi:hypothetical protein